MTKTVISCLRTMRDERSNEVTYDGQGKFGEVRLVFVGKGNRLTVEHDAVLTKLEIEFLGSDAEVYIGGGGRMGCRVLIGSDSKVILGRQLTTTSPVYMTALDGGSIHMGRDCMLAGNVQLRSDDAHAIFDVETGARINRARPIVLGNHVWLGEGCSILGGSTLGDGSIIGTRAVVKGEVPNNCVAAGNPARILRKNVAWERPHLGSEALFDKQGNLIGSERGFWSPTEN